MAWVPPPDIDLPDAYYEIAKKIVNNNWEKFARKGLRLDQNEIDDIKDECRNNRNEQKFQMCLKWQEKVGAAASVENIYAVLNHFLFPKDCPSLDLAQKPISDGGKPAKKPGLGVVTTSKSRNLSSRNQEVTQPADEEESDYAEYCSQVKKNFSVLPCTEEFYSRNVDMVSNYPRQHGKGRVIIINNSFVHSRYHREGSDIDVENMTKLWEQLGCDVDVCTDMYVEDIITKLENLSENPGKNDYCVIFIMSHGNCKGGEDVVLGNDAKTLPVKELLEMFNNKNSLELQEIPKLFFFQCCRGGTPDKGEPVAGTKPVGSVLPDSQVLVKGGKEMTDSVPSQNRLPTTSDMLICFATQHGNQAFRNTENGSWFVNAIANVFIKHAKDEHVLDLMTKVNEAVSVKSASGEGLENCKAMSDIKYTLRKKLYFYPGK